MNNLLSFSLLNLKLVQTWFCSSSAEHNRWFSRRKKPVQVYSIAFPDMHGLPPGDTLLQQKKMYTGILCLELWKPLKAMRYIFYLLLLSCDRNKVHFLFIST